MKILTSAFSNLEKTDIDAHISELTEFFQSALELRSNWDDKQEVRTKVCPIEINNNNEKF